MDQPTRFQIYQWFAEWIVPRMLTGERFHEMLRSVANDNGWSE